MKGAGKSRTVSGFSILEILVTLLITGVILQGLSVLTGGMLRGWSNKADSLGSQSDGFLALDAIADEIEALLPVTEMQNGVPRAVFAGSENYMEFARPAIGFETRIDLNRVVYQIDQGPGGSVLVRLSSPFVSSSPFSAGAQTRTVIAELKGRVRFEYSADGRDYTNFWNNSGAFPRLVRISLILDAQPDRLFSKTASPLADVTAECLSVTYQAICDYQLSNR